MSDKKPELKDLQQELKDLTWAEVKLVALHLGLDFPKLKQIEEQCSELSDRVLEAMDTWLNSDPEASWEKVVRALDDNSKTVLAQEIEEKYCNLPGM